jgi:hypothetical protein
VAGLDFVITLKYNQGHPSGVTVALTFAVAAADKGLKTTLWLLLDGVHVGAMAM